MKKRMVSLLLTLCMALTLLPATASATDLPSELYVGDVNVIGGGYWVSDGNGGITAEGATAENYNVYYDGNHGLTLRNVSITKYGWTRYGMDNYVTRGGMWAGIHTDGSINITLVGENVIQPAAANGEFDATCAGIAVGNDYQSLSFYGDGNLVVWGGSSARNSFGVFTRSSVKLAGTGEIAIYGGVCGATYVSAGIYNQGSLEDNVACVSAISGTVTVGTDHGYAASYGVYGKVALSNSGHNAYSCNFTAFCNNADVAVALSMPPLHMPVGNSALVASRDEHNWNAIEPYRTEDNGLYRYVNVKSGLNPGADVTGISEVAEARTPYSITVTEAAIVGSNPGNQVVEYAVGKEGNDDMPTTGWQTSPVFNGLAPNTHYVVWARTAATTEYAAGQPVTLDYARTMGAGITTGLCVDGVDFDKSCTTVGVPIGDAGGTVSYDHNSRTLTISGDVRITHGCVVPRYGQMAGIFSNAELHIVLEQDASLSIDLKNYVRDSALSMYLETRYPISGQCFGILNQGNLTIDAAEGCTTAPQVSINVMGAGMTAGIRTVEFRDASSAVLEAGNLTIGAVDMDITVRGESGPAFLNPQIVAQRQDGYGSVSGISSGDDIIVNGVNAADGVAGTSLTVQTVGGYQGHLFNAGATGYGEVILNGGYVSAKNNARNGVYRVSYNVIKWVDGYTCVDGTGSRVSMGDAMWIKGNARFDPNGEPVLRGTLVITGETQCNATLTATLEGFELLAGSAPVYTWYRYKYGTTSIIDSTIGNQYTLKDADAGSQIYCEMTCEGYAGKLVSAKTEKIQYIYIPTIYVNGEQVTWDNRDNVLGDGTVSYDLSTNVLTLRNANLTKTGDQAAIIVAGKDIYHSALVINLDGENTLYTTESDKMAISCSGLTIIGSGSLNAHADYPKEATIYASWELNTGESCKIITSCKEHKTTTTSDTPAGALFAGDLVAADNSSIYASVENIVDVGEDGLINNSKCSAIEVNYIATIKDNAQVVAMGGRHEAFVAGYLHIEGGSVRAENIGSGYRTGRNFSYTEKTQYAALKVTELNAANFAIDAGLKFTLSNAKLEVYSELGFGILEQNTGDRLARGEDGKPTLVPSDVVDNIVVTNSMLVVRVGEEAKAIAPVQIEDSEGAIIVDDCTVYASAAADGTGKQPAATSAFTTKGNRYAQLIAGDYVALTAAPTAGGIVIDLTAGSKATSRAVLFAAHYDANGKLLAVKSVDIAAGTTTKSEAVPFDMTAGDSYKVFLLDANGAPLCAAAAGTIS